MRPKWRTRPYAGHHDVWRYGQSTEVKETVIDNSTVFSNSLSSFISAMTVRLPQPLESFPTEEHVLIPTRILLEEGYESTSRPTTGVRQFVKRNKGLFIIAASQVFFSLMELSVKVLTALDDPVPMLEVSYPSSLYSTSLTQSKFSTKDVAARMVITYTFCQAYMCVQNSYVSSEARTMLSGSLPGWPTRSLDLRMSGNGLCFEAYLGASCFLTPTLRHVDVLHSWFTSLFGLYYSPQCMSLSAVTVLTFLSLTVTAVFGLLFLREAVSRKQGVASRKSP